jgi:hypothetical protein
VFNSHFYHSGCSVFRRGPCFPKHLPPIGQDLRLTIFSTDENTVATDIVDDAGADQRPLDSIRDMFAALRGCWVPPPKDEAQHGMEYTIRFALKRDGTMISVPRRTYSSHDIPVVTQDVYRDAIDAALKRCIPLLSVRGWREPSQADRSPFDLWTIGQSTGDRIRLDNFEPAYPKLVVSHAFSVARLIAISRTDPSYKVVSLNRWDGTWRKNLKLWKF